MSATVLLDGFVKSLNGSCCRRVWPESARKIRELADSDRVKYAKLWQLVKDVPALDLGEPIQLVPKRGDVLFWSHLLGHNVRFQNPVSAFSAC